VPYDAIVFPVHRLTSSAYSVPEGSHGIATELEKMPGYAEVNWLPPVSGGSIPVALSDLEEAVPLVLPVTWVLKALET
jgi:hypothetical protein